MKYPEPKGAQVKHFSSMDRTHAKHGEGFPTGTYLVGVGRPKCDGSVTEGVFNPKKSVT